MKDCGCEVDNSFSQVYLKQIGYLSRLWTAEAFVSDRLNQVLVLTMQTIAFTVKTTIVIMI